MYLLCTSIRIPAFMEWNQVICWRFMLGQRKFAHRPSVGPTCWVYVGPTCWANVEPTRWANVKPTCWANGGPMSKLTLAQRKTPTYYFIPFHECRNPN